MFLLFFVAVVVIIISSRVRVKIRVKVRVSVMVRISTTDANSLTTELYPPSLDPCAPPFRVG